MDGAMDKIYLLDDNQRLVSMTHADYISEDLLQTLLADYPDLLTPDKIGPEPRRWLLISRETGVPDQEDGSYGRWALDHLFLDQDGIPTLVEVKRSSDTRIRRSVVGQMLDYAANAVPYWRVDTIRTQFEAGLGDVDPDQFLADRLGVVSASAFWQQVEINLKAGKIRMIFVADEIPQELRRIVEFLNEQMSPAEVLAIAIRQYVGQGLKTLVPTLIGQTAKAQATKSAASGEKWSEDTFFPELAARHSQQEADIAFTILEWAKRRGLRIWWGEGKRWGSFSPMIDTKARNHFPVVVWTYGTIEVQFQHMQIRPPFDAPEMRRELLNRLNAIQGVSLPDDSLSRRPGFPMNGLASEGCLDQFLDTLDWFVETVRADEAQS
jgi:hypothetical protein